MYVYDMECPIRTGMLKSAPKVKKREHNSEVLCQEMAVSSNVFRILLFVYT